MQVWDALTGRTKLTYRGQTAGVWAVSWSPDGKHIASASQDQTVQVWDAMTGKRFLTYRGHAAEVWDVSWSTDGKHIVSAGNGGTVQLWNATTGKQLWLLHLLLRSSKVIP